MASKADKAPVPLKPKGTFQLRQVLLVAAAFVLVGAYAVTRVNAASGVLYASPATASVGIGSTFTVTIRENSGTDVINAVEADLTYPTDKLEFVSSDVTTSAFGVEAVNSGGNGTVTLARGTQTALTGDQVVAVVTFKALAAGTAGVAFAGSSAIVRSADQTNVLVSTTAGSYTISDKTAPTVPAGLTVGTRTISSIAMSWTASTDNVGVTGYRVYRNGTQVSTPTSTSFTDTGLSAGTSYSYTVAAYDAAGNVSSQSAASAFSTLPDTTAPTVPGTPTSSLQTMSSINLSWTSSTDNVGVTGYRVYRNGTLLKSVTTTSTSDTGLVPDTSYGYTVAAYDAAGNTSAQSGVGTFKTLPDTQAPTTPASLGTTVDRQSVVLNWTASTDNVGVATYVIYRNGAQIATTAALTYTDQTVAAGDYTYAVAARDGAGNTSVQATKAVHVNVAADINNDGKVNIFDLSALLSNWNRTGSNTSDLNGDGTVNVFDLSILLSAWTG